MMMSIRTIYLSKFYQNMTKQDTVASKQIFGETLTHFHVRIQIFPSANRRIYLTIIV